MRGLTDNTEFFFAYGYIFLYLQREKKKKLGTLFIPSEGSSLSSPPPFG